MEGLSRDHTKLIRSDATTLQLTPAHFRTGPTTLSSSAGTPPRDQVLVPQPLERLQALLEDRDREPGGFRRRRRRRGSRHQDRQADDRPGGEHGLILDDDLRPAMMQEPLEQARLAHYRSVLLLNHFVEGSEQRAQ